MGWVHLGAAGPAQPPVHCQNLTFFPGYPPAFSDPVTVPATPPGWTVPQDSTPAAPPSAPGRLATIRLDNVASMVRRSGGYLYPQLEKEEPLEAERTGFKGVRSLN